MCLDSHSETSSVSVTRRSPDLHWYGLPPPALKAVLLDGDLVHSAGSAPVPRRFWCSGPFSSEGDTRDDATFTRTGCYLPLDTLAVGSVKHNQNRNLLSFEMVPLWLAPSCTSHWPDLPSGLPGFPPGIPPQLKSQDESFLFSLLRTARRERIQPDV